MKLGLGTVQFGMPYGIANGRGQIPRDEAATILAEAPGAGIQLLDTAPGYGQSEAVLGELLPADHSFHIVTKTTSMAGDVVDSQQIAGIQQVFTHSLEKLKQNRVYGLFVHHAKDLMRPGAERLVEWLWQTKAQGFAQKIGVSVYTADEIDAVLNVFVPDIIQVPLNVLDQRLITSGHLGRLKRRGVEIVARSVFLQGILLMEPAMTGNHFQTAAPIIRQFQHEMLESHHTAVEGALAFLAQTGLVDTALVGVTSLNEWRAIAKAFANIHHVQMDWAHYALQDEQILNPTLWPANQS